MTLNKKFNDLMKFKEHFYDLNESFNTIMNLHKEKEIEKFTDNVKNGNIVEIHIFLKKYNNKLPSFIERQTQSSLLNLAVKNKDTGVIKLLLDSGACPKTNYGAPFFECFKEIGPRSIEIVKCFLDSGVTVNISNPKNENSLRVCVKQMATPDVINMVDFLIENGADVNYWDHSPLEDCHGTFFEFLLKKGANINDLIVLRNLNDPLFNNYIDDGYINKINILVEYGLDVKKKLYVDGNADYYYNQLERHNNKSVIEIYQERVDDIKRKNKCFNTLSIIKKREKKSIIIQCWARKYLARRRVFNIRSSPEHLFNNEYKDIRMKMYEMKGF